MDPFFKMFCRTFQTVLRAAIPILPYREPKTLTSVNDVPGLLLEKNIHRVLLVTDPGIYQSPLTHPLRNALAHTIATRKGTYWSRSRGEYWVKGETSGHHQAVEGVAVDCAGDTILLTVRQTGAACHTGNRTCFFTALTTEDAL